MPRIDKLPRYFDSLDQLATGDILIFQNSSEQSQNTEHTGIIIEQNKTKFLAELKNKKLTLTPLMALTSTYHLFRPRKKYQEALSEKLCKVITEHQEKPKNYKNTITFVSQIYHEASQALTNCDENTEKKDYVSYFMNSDFFTITHDLQNYLYNNVNFQYLLSPGKKNIFQDLHDLIQQEQTRLEKENNSISKYKANLIESALDEMQGKTNFQQNEVEKCINLLKRTLPHLRINTGFGIKTPTSYLKVLDFAKKHSLDSRYFDDDLVSYLDDDLSLQPKSYSYREIKNLAAGKYGYNPILSKLYKKYRKQGYSDEEARFECEPSVTAWLKLHSKASWALGLSTFGLGFLFGSLPHAIQRTQETKTKNETQYEILKKTIELENQQEIIIDNEKLENDFQYVIRTIRKKYTEVTTLSLNPGSTVINDTIAHTLTDALCNNPHIETLFLEHHSTKDAGVKAITDALKVNKTIRSLSLNSNSISDEDAEAIAQAIKVNETITTLQLIDNSISDAGIQEIAEALKENRTIKTVHFDNNSISDAGMQTFTEALKMNQSITTLHLEHSSRSDMDIQAIAETLKVNHSIKTLRLSYTSLGNAGMQAIAEILRNNDSITTLYLELKSISDTDAKTIAEALSINKTLKTLDLSKNSIGETALVHLAVELETNRTLTNLNLKPPYSYTPSYRDALEKVKKLLERNLSYESLSKRILLTLNALEEIFEKGNIDRSIYIIDNLVTLFNDLNKLPDFMADKFINETNKFIHESFAWFFRLDISSNQFTLLEDHLLPIFEGISELQIGYSAAQFELTSLYLSQLSGLEEPFMEKIEFTDPGFKEYARTLIAYLVHAENYNKSCSSPLLVYPMYELLIKIINSGKIEKNMKYDISHSLMRTHSESMALLEKPSELLIRKRYEALIYKIRELSDTLEIDNIIEYVISTTRHVKLLTSQEEHPETTTSQENHTSSIEENNPEVILDLREKNIDDAKAIALSETLKTNHTAMAVLLEKNKIGPQGAKALAGALKVNQSVKVLDLDHNSIGDAGAEALAEVLMTNDSITTLYLKHNLIHNGGVQALAEALKVNKTLQELNLGNNYVMDTKTSSLFAEALKQNNTLQKLNLNKSGLHELGAHILTEALSTNHTLTELSLRRNGLGDIGGLIIAKVLQVNSTLKKLDLSDNIISDVSAISIARTLITNHTLQELNLANNFLNTATATSIADALKTNQTLQKLDLENTRINLGDVIIIADALKINHTLQELNLANNKIGSFSIRAIAETLKTNYTLQKLNLESTQLTDKTLLSPIEDLLKRNIEYKKSYDDLNYTILRLNQLFEKQNLSAETTIEILEQLSHLLRLGDQLPANYPGMIESKGKCDEIIENYHERLHLPHLVNRSATQTSFTQFELQITEPHLINFYIGQLTQAEGKLTENTHITDQASQTYLRTLIKYLVHSENYSSDKLTNDRIYNTLAEILLSGKIKQNVPTASPQSEEGRRYKEIIIGMVNEIRGNDPVIINHLIDDKIRILMNLFEEIHHNQASSSSPRPS